MGLIKNGQLTSDPWVTADMDGGLMPDIPTIVPLARFLAEREELLRSQAELGVLVSPGEDIDALAEDLPRLKVVALSFPAFTDGRAYSYARLLRQRHGYEGEIRAVGNVLRDQYLFMHRAGFDTYKVGEGADINAWKDAISHFSVVYQPATDSQTPAWKRRHSSAAAAAE